MSASFRYISEKSIFFSYVIYFFSHKNKKIKIKFFCNFTHYLGKALQNNVITIIKSENFKLVSTYFQVS